MTVSITINGRRLDVPAGRTVLEAASAEGIEIPTLCHHPDLPLDGSCRLCVVEVEGQAAEAAACTLPVSDGMVVRTESDSLSRIRRGILELLLEGYRGDGGNEFLRWVERYGARAPEDGAPPRFEVDSDPNPFIRVDLNECILCTRCVRACADVQGRFVLGVAERGTETRIVAGADETMLEARCESCGACAAYCPTGALEDRAGFGLGPADRKVETTCPYCGVGCRFDLEVKNDRIVRVASNPAAPVNGMHLCVKGRYGFDFVHHAERLRGPMVREHLLAGRTRAPDEPRGAWVEVDWERALDLVAESLASIREESGPDAVGLLTSAKCTNEDNYLVQKLARQVIGTHSVDHCARLCHSSTVAGLAAAFGSGAMSNTMRDIAEEARAALLIGTNTTEQHPVFGSMLRQAVRRGDLEIVVADPRAIDITEFAALHLRQRPGTDVALVNGLMHVILERGWEDGAFIEARTEGFEAVRETARAYDPGRVEAITGVPAADLVAAAEILATRKPMAVIWAMGITQHVSGVKNVRSLANLQMLLGNMGVPGGGVNPLRGQNNVQGACDMGGLPNVFPGYRPVTDDAARRELEEAWALDGAKSGLFSEAAGLTLTEMVDRARDREVRGLFILAENPLMTDPDTNHVRECLERAELVVLSEIFPSETAACADVLLPGVSWAEKDGTFTNTERRVQRVNAAVPAPGDARPEWQLLPDLARRILERTGRAPRGPWAAWDYESPAVIMEEIAAVTPIYGGVSHDRLARGEALHWPVPDASHPGTPILHRGRFTRGRGRFHPCEQGEPDERPDGEYPFVLTTGRVLYHWHGAEMTRRVPGLLDVHPESLVEIHPEDADRLGLAPWQRVRVTSRRGAMVARALRTKRPSPGLVFANFHFPGDGNVNNVTNSALDPVAKIPEYKVCAVRVEPISD
jgi:formate dehydrogenase alpha subunit